MRTLCYSVRLESFVKISDKAFLAKSFDGSQDVIPASQVFGHDYDVDKCEAYWISAWILGKKSIQYSKKKAAYFDEGGKKSPVIKIEKHVPVRIEPISTSPDESLTR